MLSLALAFIRSVTFSTTSEQKIFFSCELCYYSNNFESNTYDGMQQEGSERERVGEKWGWRWKYILFLFQF